MAILSCLPRHYSVNPQLTLVYFSFFSNTALINTWGILPPGFPCITSHLRLFTDLAASFHIPAIPLHHCFILATDSLRLNSHDFSFLKAFSELFSQLLIIKNFYLFIFGCTGSWLGSPGGSMVKKPPVMQEMWVWSLGGDDLLQKGMATHSSILARKITWESLAGCSP